VAVVVTREEYFAAAMSTLATSGHSALKIGVLCKRLGVTTGSFYHYFGSLDGFVDALLEYWEREQTIRIVRLATAPDDPVERMHRMKELALTVPHDAEAGIRAWSKSNAAVAVTQKRVDAERVDALRKVISGIIDDRAHAELLATIGITLLVGLQQWRSPVDLQELSTVFDEFEAVITRYTTPTNP
jgi:AcrR family transcriptional regulator